MEFISGCNFRSLEQEQKAMPLEIEWTQWSRFYSKIKNVVETILFLCVNKKDLLIKCGIRLHDMRGIYEVKFA